MEYLLDMILAVSILAVAFGLYRLSKRVDGFMRSLDNE